MRLKEVV